MGCWPRLEDMPLLETFPAFGRVLTDSCGYLWWRTTSCPGESVPAWTVFDSQGRVLGLLDLPRT